jgi:hypothetical protein
MEREPRIEDEFRVEVELSDEGHGLTLGERLRALDLDDEAQDRLGSRVIVTRDGPHLFLYANTRESCAEAERVVRELIAEDDLEAEVRATRWHPVAEEWRDADEPLPDTPEAVEAERRMHEAREAAEGEEPLHAPEFVLLSRYKPKFLRDLGF